MASQKDIEFGKLLHEIEFGGTEQSIDYDKMNAIIDYIEKLNITKENFNDNKRVLSKLLYKLSSHIFGMSYNKDDWDSLKIYLPGSHDFNVCLGDNYFNYNLYENFYKDFIKTVKVIIDSKGREYPRYFYEIDKIRNEKKEVSFLKITNIYIEKKDLPKDIDFSKCKLGKYYRFKGAGRLGTPEEILEMYKRIFSNNYEEYYEDYMIKEYPVSKEIMENVEKYEHLENMRKED